MARPASSSARFLRLGRFLFRSFMGFAIGVRYPLMDPAEVVEVALRELWQPPPPGEPDVFPGNREQAEVAVAALRSAGFLVVPDPGLNRVLDRAHSRLRGRPSWSDDYDGLAAAMLALFPQHGPGE